MREHAGCLASNRRSQQDEVSRVARVAGHACCAGADLAARARRAARRSPRRKLVTAIRVLTHLRDPYDVIMDLYVDLVFWLSISPTVGSSGAVQFRRSVRRRFPPFGR